MLTNLVLNALDAMPDGGVLSIGTQMVPGRTVMLTVTDTGIGMTDDIQERIFEPFFSTKGEAGTGLGLSMAYSIIKRHGGEVHVESAPGSGTTFTVSFPVAEEPAGRDATGRTAEARSLARILVIDDDAQVLAVLGELLRSVGHTVTTALNGPMALAAYVPGRFDVVLSNIGMAEMNGWEVARRVRVLDADVPIIFLSGWGLREDDRARLDALHIHTCLFKPVGPAEVDAAIQAALRTARRTAS
jgi:CheY-like chemotaxis protein